MNPQGPYLKTERAIIRLPESSDAAALVDFHLENKDFFKEYDPPTPDDFFTVQYWNKSIQQSQNSWLERRALRLIIIHKENKSLIGTINFTSFERGPFQCCRLGYKLGQKYNGQGLMTEALSAGLRYIFDELNFHRVEANYIPSNKRSEKLLFKLGFTQEGEAKNYLFINGDWQDHNLTSLTNLNWKAP